MNPADPIDDHLRARLRSEIFGMAIGLACCAFGGFYMFNGLTTGGTPVDAAFVWALRGGVVGFGVCIILAYLGERIALAVDAVVCGVLAAVLVVTCVAWLAESVYVGQVFMVGISGVLAGGAALRSWREFTAWRGATSGSVLEREAASPIALDDGPSIPPATTEIRRRLREDSPPPQQRRPDVSVSPESQPGESPPEGGFLADLAREDDQTD